MTRRQSIENRIRTQCKGFRQVGGAINEAALEGRLLVYPAVFVIPLAIEPKPNQTVGLNVSQDIVEVYGLLIVTRSLLNDQGADGFDTLETLRHQIRLAFQTPWRPADHWAPMEYADGRLHDFQDGILIWRETYITTGHSLNDLP